MIDTVEAVKLLEDVGLTPVLVYNEEEDINHVFIEKKVVWDKFFTHISEDENIRGYLDQVPHLNWIKRIIISRNPEIDQQPYEGQLAWVIELPEIRAKEPEKIRRLDKCLGYVFYIISNYLSAIMAQFTK